MSEDWISQVRSLPEGQVLQVPLAQVPMAELLLAVHESRFTGGFVAGVDRFYFRDGALVGLLVAGEAGLISLRSVLGDLRLLGPEDLNPLLMLVPEDSLALVELIQKDSLLSEELISRATAEQLRRRLFGLYENNYQSVELRGGLQELAHFHPAYVDVRPAIAFGMVVHTPPNLKETILKQVAGQRASLLVPYDEKRNSYGLPPPITIALRDLAGEGIRFGPQPSFGGLSQAETAGVLWLMQRMGLLKLVQ